MLQRLIKHRSTYIIFGAIFLVIFFVSIIVLALTFQKIYQQKAPLPSTLVRQIDTQKQKFYVGAIMVRDLDSNCHVLIQRNGQAEKYCNGILVNTSIIASEIISNLFSLTKEQFESLLTDYFSDSLNLEITIQTTHGTKTFVVNSSSTNLPDDFVDDFIDDTQKIEDDLDQPPPSPPPSLAPTPTPTYNPSQSPFPSPSPSVSPTPYQLNNFDRTQPSFNCGLINQFDVTVSNTRCLDPNDQPLN